MQIDASVLISSAVLIAQIGTAFYLRNVISSKDKVIKDQKYLLELLDVKKIAEYYEAKDNIRTETIIAQVEQEVINWNKKTAAQIGNQFDELASFVGTFIEAMGDNIHAREWVKENLPSCESLFSRYYLNDNNNTQPGSGNNQKGV